MKKQHVLLIDDDEDEPEIFSEALKKLKIAVDCYSVTSAEHAIRFLGEFVPDFIFVDYNMPKMNGLTCMKEIRKIKSLDGIPMVLYSNNLDKDVVAKATLLGVVTCIQKPSKMDVLVEKLKDVFLKDGKNGQDGLEVQKAVNRRSL